MNVDQTRLACLNYLKLDTSFQGPEMICDYIQEKRGNLSEYKDYVLAIRVLYENYKPFRDRVTKVRIDGWLTKDKFKPIAAGCYEILKSMEKELNEYQLEDWQIKLMNWFGWIS